MLSSAINWFEIPAEDFARALAFYSALYGESLPFRETGQSLMGFFPHDPGNGIGGAIVKADGCQPASHGPRIYLNAGDDLAVMLDRVEEAGGRVLRGKQEIAPGVGFTAKIADTEGNVIYLHSMN